MTEGKAAKGKTEAAWTPGPWHWMADLVRNQMPVLVGSDGMPICDFGMDTTYYPVEGTPPEAPEARLIAAAPELYDGCNALLGLIQLIQGRDDLSAELREVLTTSHRIEEAEAAVAKARGLA